MCIGDHTVHAHFLFMIMVVHAHVFQNHGGSCSCLFMTRLVHAQFVQCPCCHAHVTSCPWWFLHMVYVYYTCLHDAYAHVTLDQSGSCTHIVFISSSGLQLRGREFC